MRYRYSPEWTDVAKRIVQFLSLQHIDLDRIAVVESRGSRARRTIARIHSLGKVMQLGMNERPFYTIELLSEQFERQCREDKIKTILHELMHIPSCFGGGFRHHKGLVSRGAVEKEFQKIKHLFIHNSWGNTNFL